MYFEKMLLLLVPSIYVCSCSLHCRYDKMTELYGQKCLDGNMTSVSDGFVDRRMCITECIRRQQCQSLHYSIRYGLCFLSQELCVELGKDEHYNVIFIGRLTSKQCLSWVPSSKHNEAIMISTDDCEDNPSDSKCYVGRVKHGPHIIPGKFILVQMMFYSALDGTRIKTEAEEILDLLPVCKVTWVPYIAGNGLPTEAVVTGYLANGSDTRLYTIRGPFPGTSKTMLGYYDPTAKEGYIEKYVVRVLTQMEMLVLV